MEQTPAQLEPSNIPWKTVDATEIRQILPTELVVKVALASGKTHFKQISRSRLWYILGEVKSSPKTLQKAACDEFGGKELIMRVQIHHWAWPLDIPKAQMSTTVSACAKCLQTWNMKTTQTLVKLRCVSCTNLHKRWEVYRESSAHNIPGRMRLKQKVLERLVGWKSVLLWTLRSGS